MGPTLAPPTALLVPRALAALPSLAPTGSTP